MASLLDRKLIVVTGKGGTGKTTVACALGLLGARSGRRTIVVELGDQYRLPALFGSTETPEPGVEIALEQNLWSTSMDPDRALIAWLQKLTGRITARLLASSSTFHYFAAAAPGAKELVSMVKVRELCEAAQGNEARGASRRHGQAEERGYDLVVLDAPATGHALAMLRSPQTFAAIVRLGPLAEQAREVRELLADPSRCAYIAVAQGTDMAVTETLELEEGLRRHLDRGLDAVVVNGTMPRRFTREELERISAATSDGSSAEDSVGGSNEDSSPRGNGGSRKEPDKNQALARSAGRMAHAVYERTRLQQSQIARLRRQRFAQGNPPRIATIPFVFTRELDLATVRRISTGLERKL
jgi:anion-transporting  ArsA/GET3 family ATPase